MKTMHHCMAALSAAPDRPEGAARRNPPPSVRTAAALTLLISMMTATGPTLANVGCPPGSSAPDCAAPQSDSALTASFHGAPAAHNGKKLFAFEIRFSQTFDALRLGAFKKALSVTGGRVVDVKRTVRGQNGAVTVRVRPNSSDALTVTLAATTAGGGSLTVPGPSTPPPSPPPVSPPPVSPPVTDASTIETPATETSTTETPTTETPTTKTPAPLTAAFHGVPEEHDGKKLFSFEIRFSEEFTGMRLSALKRALAVTNGRVVDVKRTVRGENRRVTVRVRPTSYDPVTVALAATEDCAVAGAICANDGRKLSGSSSMNINPTAWGGQSVGTPIAYSLASLKSLGLPPPPPQAKTVVKTVSATAPEGFPGGTGTVVNMNAMGIWGEHPSLYANGSPTSKNTAVDLQLRERWDRGGHTVVKARCIKDGAEADCYAGQFPEGQATNWGNLDTTVGTPFCGVHSDTCKNNPPAVDIYGRWFAIRTTPARAT